MQYLKRFVLPTLLVAFAIFTFGCQSESAQEPEPTDPPVEEGVPEGEPSEPRVVDIDEITNITWQWAELVENEPAAQSVVPDPQNYTLTFWDDGSFDIKADYNSGSGNYTVNGSQIEFGPMVSTMAMCGAESLYDQYMALLGQVELYSTIMNIPNFFDRISFKFTLNPFDYKETKEMIEFRLKQAGYKARRHLFLEDGIKRVYEYTNGYPRKITMLCHKALKKLIMDNKLAVDGKMIDEIIKEEIIGGWRQTNPPPRRGY